MKGIKLLIFLIFFFVFPGKQFLFSQDRIPKPEDSIINIQENEQTGISLKKELIFSGQSLKTDKTNLIPVRKKFDFNLKNLLRGLLGMIILILITYLLSENKKQISWKIVGLGLLCQVLLAIGILQIPFLQAVFEFGGKVFVKILDFTNEGTEFLFKSMVTGKIEAPLQTFAIKILPTIIFFSAITSVLFYYGVIQKIVWFLAWILSRFLKVSGAEGLSVAGNIFLGMSESPLMIKAYLEKMNRSELMLVMSGGMATMAGGVLALYINFLGGDDPVQRLEFAKHLLAASVMAAPGIVVISKIMIPQTMPVDREVKIKREKAGKNVLDAVSNGTYDGLKLAINVAAMLLVFLAFLALFNFILMKAGNWTDINGWIAKISDERYNQLSLQFILGYALSPLMWLLGIGTEDITLVGSLLGEKLVMTEFVGYISLAQFKASGLFADPRSIVMATYILCGFANFASVGIQIAAIGALAPNQRVLISRIGMKSLIAGTLASLLSATIVGVIIG